MSFMQAEFFALNFLIYLQSPTEYQQVNFSLSPVFRPTEGGEGSLDTSMVNGYSLQRTGYYEMTDPVTKTVKIVSVSDGQTFDNSLQTITDYL
jgi:hypothetical protein